MPEFLPFVKTTLGASLDDKLGQSGQPLQLTRLAYGSGQWPDGTLPETLTALMDERLSGAPGAATPYEGGSYRVGGVLTNQGLAEGFHWRESGLFALDPDEGEILYQVARAADQAKVDWVPAEGVCFVEDYFSFLVLSASGIAVTVRLDDTVVLATRRDLARLRRLWQLTARTGGAAGSLDAIPWGEIEPDDTAEVFVEGVLWRYRWDKDNTAAESNPTVIVPDDAAGRPGRWVLRGTVGEAELRGALDAEVAARASADTSLTNTLAGKAPTAHASTATTYGAASEANYGHVQLSNVAPAALGTAAKGASTRAAKADHVHAMPTATQVGAAPASHTQAISTIIGLLDALNAKQATIADGGLSVAKLDIDGATDIGANLADADLIIVDDGAVGVNRKSAVSRIWTYISGKITGAISGLLTTNLTSSRALVSDASGKVAVSAVTSAELAFLDGVTSAVQTQLNGKAASTHSHAGTEVSAATTSARGTTELATGAEAATGTDATRPITPSTLRSGLNAAGSAPVFACRAWVNFDGTVSSGDMRRAFGNVSSVGDNGVGDYTIYFASAMQDANYAVDWNAVKAGNNSVTFNNIAPAAANVRLYELKNQVGQLLDATHISVKILR